MVMGWVNVASAGPSSATGPTAVAPVGSASGLASAMVMTVSFERAFGGICTAVPAKVGASALVTITEPPVLARTSWLLRYRLPTVTWVLHAAAAQQNTMMRTAFVERLMGFADSGNSECPLRIGGVAPRREASEVLAPGLPRPLGLFELLLAPAGVVEGLALLCASASELVVIEGGSAVASLPLDVPSEEPDFAHSLARGVPGKEAVHRGEGRVEVAALELDLDGGDLDLLDYGAARERAPVAVEGEQRLFGAPEIGLLDSPQSVECQIGVWALAEGDRLEGRGSLLVPPFTREQGGRLVGCRASEVLGTPSLRLLQGSIGLRPELGFR